jgi:hypothetical protein
MRQLFLLLLLPFLINAQSKNEIINPKGKWYFGAEIGTNKISSLTLGEPNKSFQGGVLAENYFARHWSLSARIKYFETGVSFYKPNTHSGSWFDLGSDEYFGSFNGAVIAVPLNLKWEFRLYKNLGASIKLGYSQTFETKREYGKYSPNLNPNNYPTEYGSFNVGYGFNYFVDKKMAVYIDFEYYNGGSKGYSNGFLHNFHYPNENKLTNFGTKYNFKK